MRLDIFWSNEAIDTFDNIVSLIENNWTEKQANSFVQHTQKILNLIADYPFMYKSALNSDVRQAFISRQTSLYYEVHDQYITLLFFWDNRQAPFL